MSNGIKGEGRFAGVVALLVLQACASQQKPASAESSPSSTGSAEPRPTPRAAQCSGRPLTVHFYDVAQALAALVDLPDGRHILVDTGDQANRAGCGAPCKTASEHLITALVEDLGRDPLALVWITHQHSDHIGGVVKLMSSTIVVQNYVDNGRDGEKDLISRSREAAVTHGAKVSVVDPANTTLPFAASDNEVTVTAVLPGSWPADCDSDPNEYSIGLRVDYCQSSILFTGDAEDGEEAQLTTTPVTLLQVGHHGSNTSTAEAFVDEVSPKYAVISAGKPGEGMNKTYCHPRTVTIETLTQKIGGSTKEITAFDGAVSCKGADSSHWPTVRGSDAIYDTARDGDVVLTTTGDGSFIRKESRP